MGRDTAKRKAQAGSHSSVNTQSSRSKELGELRNEFAGLRTSLDNHMEYSANQDTKFKRLEEMKLFFQDMGHLSGPMLKFAMVEKTRIMEKWSYICF